MNKTVHCKFCQAELSRVLYHLRCAKVYCCKTCDLHFTDYVDETNDSTAEETESLPDEQEKFYLRNQLQYNQERFTKQVICASSLIKHFDHPKILDVGMGGGLFLSMISAKVKNLSAFGTDTNLKRIAFAKKEYGLNNLFSYPLEHEYWAQHHISSFHLISFWDVVEHVNQPLDLFNAAHNLLADDGMIIVDTPCRDSFFYKFGQWSYWLTRGLFPTFLNIMYSNKPFGHKQIFSIENIKTLCQHSGFEIKSIDSFHEMSFPIHFYLTKWIQNKGILKLLTPLANKVLNTFPIKNKMMVIASRIPKTR